MADIDADGGDVDADTAADANDADADADAGTADGDADAADADTSTDAVESDPLVAWGLGAFHAAALVALLIGLGHADGSLGDLLDGLNTAIGLSLYLVLWGLSWLTTGRVLERVDLGANSGRTIGWGMVGGSVTGVAFFLVVALGVILPNFLTDGVDLGLVAFLVIFLSVGVLVAALVGAVLGGVFAVVDLALYRFGGLVGAHGRVDNER